MVADCVLREDEPLELWFTWDELDSVGNCRQGGRDSAAWSAPSPLTPDLRQLLRGSEALRDQAALIQPSSAGTTSRGTPSIDIPRGLRSQLEQCGVDEVIEIGICTRGGPMSCFPIAGRPLWERRPGVLLNCPDHSRHTEPASVTLCHASNTLKTAVKWIG